MTTLSLLLLAALPAQAQLPDFYRKVSRVTWVVRDVNPVVEGWTKLGLAGREDHGEVELPGLGRLRVVTGRLGDVILDFLQPAASGGPFSTFVERHGDGVFSLMYPTPTLEALDQEVERLRGLGVGVLQRGRRPGAVGDVSWVYFDTQSEGKYVLGLIHDPGWTQPTASPSGPRITQFAFVARDARPVSAFWKKLGFPEMSFTNPVLRDLEYRGKSTHYQQELGWQRHGSVPFEWCVPLKGVPSVYQEFLDKHGEGLQHIGLNVPDMDKALAEWKALGFQVSQAGAWGERGKPGSGRFAYMDTDSIGGVTVELLWSYRQP